MKIVKFGAIALALGLFAASCNNEATTSEATTDSTVMAPAPMESAPMTTTPDTTMSTTTVAPAAGSDTATMKMETKTEVKH